MPKAVDTKAIIATLPTLKSSQAVDKYLEVTTADWNKNDFSQAAKAVKTALDNALIEVSEDVLVEYKPRVRENKDGSKFTPDKDKPVYAGLAFLWSKANESAATQPSSKRKTTKKTTATKAPKKQNHLDTVALYEMCREFILEPINADENAWKRKAISVCFFTGRRIFEVLEAMDFSVAGMHLMNISGILKTEGRAKKATIPVMYDADIILKAIQDIRTHISKERSDAIQEYRNNGGINNSKAVWQLSNNIAASVLREHNKTARAVLEGCAEVNEGKEATHGLRRAYAATMVALKTATGEPMSTKGQLRFAQESLVHEEAATSLEYLEFIAVRVDELAAMLGKPFKMDLDYGLQKVQTEAPTRKFSFHQFLDALANSDDRATFQSILETSDPASGRFELELARSINAKRQEVKEAVIEAKKQAAVRVSGDDRARAIIECLFDWNKAQQDTVPSRPLYISDSIIRKISKKHSTELSPTVVRRVVDEIIEAIDNHHYTMEILSDTNLAYRGKLDEIMQNFIEKYHDRL